MGEIADSETTPDTNSQDQEISELKVEVDLRRHGWRYARAIVIGFLILQLAGLRVPGENMFDTYAVYLFNKAAELTIVYLAIVLPIGIIVYILGRVVLLISKRRGLNKEIQLLLDFVISSALVVTLIVNLGIFLSWTSAFLASPIFDIPILSLIENSIVILSMFFLALGVYYRFLSRLYLRVFAKPKLSSAYLRESGRMVDRAIGHIVGLVTAVSMSTFTHLWFLAIPLLIQLFTQYEKIQVETGLERNMFPLGEIREPIPSIAAMVPRQKFVYQQFRFSLKPLSRWIILSVGLVTGLYFISTTEASSILTFVLGSEDYYYTSVVNPFIYWSVAMGIAILSLGTFIVIYLVYSLRKFERPEGHILSPRHRFEWLADLGVSAVAFALLMFYLLPQIGIGTWNSMRLNLFWNPHHPITPGFALWTPTLIASLFQVCSVLILVGVILRMVINAMGFLGKEEITVLRWQLQSGKILLVGVSLAIGINVLLTGGMYFGVVSGGIVMAGLALLLATMMFSKARLQEIAWFDVGGERS